MLNRLMFSQFEKALCFTTTFFLFTLLAFSGCATQKDRPSFSEEAPQLRSREVLIVPLFENETFEPVLERSLTQIFKETLFERGFSVESRNKSGAKVLLGRIKSFGLRPISLNPIGAAREYRVEIGLSVALLEAAGGPERFSMQVQGRADYIARPDPGGDRIAKDRAIRAAGRDMAEQLAAALDAARDAKGRGTGE